MTSDEFEREHNAPLSPDERMWRHPAELADAERHRHLSQAPPVGRRLTALTAAVCVVASLAILAIAVPKGISEYQEAEAESSATTTPISPFKSALSPLVATVSGTKGPATAVSLGHGCWVVASDSVDTSERMWLTLENGEEYQVKFVSTTKDIPATLLHLHPTSADQLVGNWQDYLIPQDVVALRSFSILDRNGIHHFTDEESLQLTKNRAGLPLVIDTPLDGTAAIVDEQNSIVGIAVNAQHGAWYLAKESLHTLLKTAPFTAP